MKSDIIRQELAGRRILVVAEDLKPGGATVVLGRILGFLRASGAEVTCVTKHLEAAIAAELDVRCDADAGKGGWGLRGRLAEIPRIRRLLKKYRPELVVVNVTSPGYMFAFMFTRVPVLYHLHPPIEDKGKFARHLVYPRLRKRGKRVIVVSQWQRENVRIQWGLRESLITVLPNYPDRRVGMHKERDTVLTAARLSPDKNPAFWLEVGKRLQPFLEERAMQMIWCAPSISEVDRLSMGPLPARLRLVEIRDQAELNEHFSRAVIYYQPSLLEPQGIAVLEAMQNGIPCVVTAGTGMTDAVVDGETGNVVPQGDIVAHVDALKLLLSNPEQCTALGEAARNRIDQEYGPDMWRRSYSEVVSDVLGVRRQASR